MKLQIHIVESVLGQQVILFEDDVTKPLCMISSSNFDILMAVYNSEKKRVRREIKLKLNRNGNHD